MIEHRPINILFSIGKLNIYSWGTIVALAFLIVYILCIRKIKKEKLEERIINDLFIIAIIFGFLGARFLYAIENGFDNFYAVWHGGLSIYGGLLLGFFSIFIYLKIKKISLRYIEIIALFLPIGLAIGRLGCFINWDDYGIPTNLPWAIKVGDDAPRHPSQIYEIIVNLGIFLILFFIDKKDRKKIKKNKEDELKLTKWFLFLYPITRLFLDFLRDSARYVGLTLAQWISIAILACLFLLILIKKFKNIK
ncbi:MAG: prolipoprotein diacylglyceryl transferase [Candidatus Pacearchaeota archaeon]